MPAIRRFSRLYSFIRLLSIYCGVIVTCLIGSRSAAYATDAQCAEIKFSLSQQASFERQAFDARLTLHNASPIPLTDVKVELRFLDTQLRPVLASTEGLSSQARFFYQLLIPNTGLSTVTSQRVDKPKE